MRSPLLIFVGGIALIALSACHAVLASADAAAASAAAHYHKRSVMGGSAFGSLDRTPLAYLLTNRVKTTHKKWAAANVRDADRIAANNIDRVATASHYSNNGRFDYYYQ